MNFVKNRLKWFFLIASILCSGSGFAASQSSEVHLSFQERVMTGYALLSLKATPQEKKSIYARAAKFISQSALQPIQSVTVENFEAFLSSYRGEFPESGNLELDLKRIETQPPKSFIVYKSASPRVQRQIDHYLERHAQFFSGLPISNFQELTSISLEKLDQIFESLAEKHLQQFNTIGTKISTSAFNLIPDPLDRIRLRILFDQYYTLQSLSNKKQIIWEMIGKKLNLTDQEKFELMVQNSGPQFQKLLQVIVRQKGIPQELKNQFKILEDSTRPAPWWQVEELLKQEKNNYHFTYFEKKPLGVGTMAQVHRAKILVNGERRDVVVRFLKPGIAGKVDEDHRILSQVAAQIDQDPEYRRLHGPLMSPLMQDIRETVRAELDLKATIARQMQAKVAYDNAVLLQSGDFKGEVQFYVPTIYGADKNSQLMIQEMVIGRSLDKEALLYSDLAPEMKKTIIEAVAKLWLKEVLFGSGFFHSDLHQGNFLVRVGEPKTQVTLLDFGMGGRINSETQKLMILLGIALELQKPEFIADIYWKVSVKDKNELNREDFLAKISRRVQELKVQKAKENMFDWTGWASDEGLRLPYEFINLNRGLLIIEKSLQEAGSSLDINTIAKSLGFRQPGKILMALNSYSPLKVSDLMKLGWLSVSTKPVENNPSAHQPVILRCEHAFAP